MEDSEEDSCIKHRKAHLRILPLNFELWHKTDSISLIHRRKIFRRHNSTFNNTGLPGFINKFENLYDLTNVNISWSAWILVKVLFTMSSNIKI